MSVSIGLSDEETLTNMIHSKEWWIMVGNHHVYEKIEECFYPEADGSFMTVFGPPIGPFAGVFAGLMVLHFGRKTKMSPAQLTEFLNGLRESEGLPPLEFDNKKDIIFMVDPAEVSDV
jgi:hypothetical protein